MLKAVRQVACAVSLLATLAQQQTAAHGIPAKEEQFAGGIPVTDERQQWPLLELTHDGRGWHVDSPVMPLGSIRLIAASNRDSQEHLLVIGTAGSLADQALMHRLMPERRSDYPNTRWVEGGGSATLTWEFNRRGEVVVQCLISGHDAEAPLTLSIQALTGP